MQIHKKSGRVPDFLYFEREKVSEWELLDDFGTAYGPFLLVGETVVSRQPKRRRPTSAAFSRGCPGYGGARRLLEPFFRAPLPPRTGEGCGAADGPGWEMYPLKADIRQYRIIEQERFASKFCVLTRRSFAVILDVLP